MTRDLTRQKEFGRAIRRARGARQWSQRELAARAGISPTTLGDLERGQADPESPTMVPVYTTLGWPDDAGERFLKGDRDFLEHEAFLSRVARLDPTARAQLEAELDRLLGEQD